MRALVLTAALLALWGGGVAAQHAHAPPAAACTDPVPACATAATPAVAADGTVFLAFSAGGRVAVARWVEGKGLGAPVVVSGPPAAIDDNGEARPKVFSAGDALFVTWTVRRPKGYEGDVWLARSTDGGRSFSAPARLSDDPDSQRFETLVFAPGGRVGAVWIDKRRTAKGYRGAALAAAWSEDGGASFGPSKILADHSCECCRLGTAALADGTPVLVWRHVFEGSVRDHAAATLGPDGLGEPRRVAVDDWKVEGCPHHGPALAVDQAGRWQAAWFTDGAARQGLFHARSEDGGRTFSSPRAVGDPDAQPSHPALLEAGGRLWLAWKEFDGRTASVMAQSSTDGGASWSSPHRVAATQGASDHPLLVAVGGEPRLSWLTRAEGWRLLRLEGGP